MVASLNAELGVAETSALLKSYLDARTASDEAALLRLDGHRAPSVEDFGTPTVFAARAKAMAHVLEQCLSAGDTSAFADQVKDLLAGRCVTAEAARRNERLVSAALSQAAIASLKMQELHAKSRYPEAVTLPAPVIEDCSFDPRILRIMGRMRPDDHYGDVLTYDQIRQFLAGSDFRGAPDDLRALVDDEAVERFAQQRPSGSVVPVCPAEPATSLLPALAAVPATPVLNNAPILLPPAVARVMHDHAADFVPTALLISPSAPPSEEMTISAAWPMFEAAMRTDKRWKRNVIKQSIATQRIIVSVLGDIKPSEIQPAACEQLKALFLELPNNYHKNPRWRAEANKNGLQGVAAVHQAEVAANTATAPTNTLKTWNRHVTALNAFYAWAWKAVLNRTGKPPSLDLHIEIDDIPMRNRSDQERIDSFFAQEQVATIFSSTAFVSPDRLKNGTLKLPSRYFGSLILAHTGARREEIFQLKVKHFKHVDVSLPDGTERRFWYIDLKNDPDLKLKNIAARRYIPLHETLLKLGIVEHLVEGRSPEEALFHDVNEAAASKGDAYGKWALALYKKLGLPPRGNHKWRHTFVTYLNRALVQAGHIEELVGHTGIDRDEMRLERLFEARRSRQGNSERSSYDAGLEVADLQGVIDKLAYTFDFSRLPTWRPLPLPDSSVGAHANH
ncbi:MAG: tyrosine-type recombinase/integrase [Beijerinckiaceae bacterium]